MNSLSLRERIAAAFNLLPTAIYDTFPAVLFGCVLVIACRLWIFESLVDHPRTAGEVAGSLQLHPRGVELILASLTASGYVRKKNQKYTLTPQAKKWLLKSSPAYIGNFLAYIGILHSHWNDLEKTLRQGFPPKTYVETFTTEDWTTFTLGMMDLARLTMPYVLPKLTIPLHSRNLLDICGSHGLYSIELCKRYPSLQATIADFPDVLATTGGILQEHGMQERIKTLPCNVLETSFGRETSDVVLAFNIVHGFDEEKNSRLFHVIASALRPGGIVFILDQLEDQGASGAARLLPLMVGLNVFNEIGGSIYSFEKIKTFCRDAGLHAVTLHRLRLPGVTLVRAEKPPLTG